MWLSANIVTRPAGFVPEKLGFFLARGALHCAEFAHLLADAQRLSRKTPGKRRSCHRTIRARQLALADGDASISTVLIGLKFTVALARGHQEWIFQAAPLHVLEERCHSFGIFHGACHHVQQHATPLDRKAPRR